MIQLQGMCPDDRAGWPVFPDCSDTNASATNCATQSSIYNAMNYHVVGGTEIQSWNSSQAWLWRAADEIQILATLEAQEMRAYGSTNTTNLNTTTIDTKVMHGIDKPPSETSSPVQAEASLTAQATAYGAKRGSIKTALADTVPNGPGDPDPAGNNPTFDDSANDDATDNHLIEPIIDVVVSLYNLTNEQGSSQETSSVAMQAQDIPSVTSSFPHPKCDDHPHHPRSLSMRSISGTPTSVSVTPLDDPGHTFTPPPGLDIRQPQQTSRTSHH
ncbi:MAG: hypothetical protein LQ340_001063 [Diploschistes diacapsis]|nr:MAG: hypothetical protein LQ340_001063 [Diploschistes diacapsis]